MSEYVTDWGLTKLLISLDTGMAGLLIYGEEHLLKYPSSKGLLIVSIACPVISLLLALRCAGLLLNIDEIRDERNSLRQANPAYDLPNSLRIDVLKRLTTFRQTISIAMFLFGLGVIVAFTFFLWNISASVNTAAMSSRLSNVQSPAVTEPKMTNVPCNPLFDGWHLVTISPTRYLLYCLILALVFRVLHSLLRARAVNTGDFPHEPNRGHTELKGFGKASWYNFKGVSEFKEHSDLWIPFGIGLIELAAFPILLVLGQFVIIGGWLGIKTAGAWMGWNASRTSFNRFLFFNLFNILVAYFWLSHYIQLLPCSR